MKILIAEDDTTSKTMLEAILRKWGHEVISHATGMDAWEAMQASDAPRLLILDWVMPGMDGLVLCRKLREQTRSDPIYIIMLTAHGERANIVQGLDAGADDYITKPYDSDELRARLNVGLRILDLQSELAKRERLQGVLEMAGGVCHELNQPLQSLLGYADLLMLDMAPDDPRKDMLKKMQKAVMHVGDLTRKIMGITQYRTKDHFGKIRRIVDIQTAGDPLP